VAWRDGKLQPTAHLAVPALSLASLYGLALFETVRVYHRHPFALHRHLERLRAAAERLELDCPWLTKPATLRTAISQVLEASHLANAAVRLTLSALGEHGDDPRPCLTIAARPFAGYPAHWYSQGLQLVVAPWRRCAQDLPPSLKSANYLTCLAARRYAQAQGAQEALLLNCHGRVAEGSFTNVFAVLAGDSLVTPPASEGLLPGVTRGIVLELAARLGLAAQEQPLTLPQLCQASEVFVTGSLIEIAPVSHIEGQAVAHCPGPVTSRLLEAYRRMVAQQS
jgi:branched-subunit amino acid aminotransferase/4-amino-4-deoxychorismate lyase